MGATLGKMEQGCNPGHSMDYEYHKHEIEKQQETCLEAYNEAEQKIECHRPETPYQAWERDELIEPPIKKQKLG